MSGDQRRGGPRLEIGAAAFRDSTMDAGVAMFSAMTAPMVSDVRTKSGVPPTARRSQVAQDSSAGIDFGSDSSGVLGRTTDPHGPKWHP